MLVERLTRFRLFWKIGNMIQCDFIILKPLYSYKEINVKYQNLFQWAMITLALFRFPRTNLEKDRKSSWWRWSTFFFYTSHDQVSAFQISNNVIFQLWWWWNDYLRFLDNSSEVWKCLFCWMLQSLSVRSYVKKIFLKISLWCCYIIQKHKK